MSTAFAIKPLAKFGGSPKKEFQKFGMMDTTPSKGRTLEGVVATVRESNVSAYPERNERGQLRNTHSKARVQIADEVLAAAPSVMADITQEILDLLDRDDSDSAITLTQKHLLRTVIMMFPEAERMIRASKSARGIHNFNILVNSCREIMADIQMARDNKFLATGINVRVLQPGMIDIVNMHINYMSILKGEITQYVPAEKRMLVNTSIDNATKTVAKHMQDVYKDMSTKIEQHLS